MLNTILRFILNFDIFLEIYQDFELQIPFETLESVQPEFYRSHLESTSAENVTFLFNTQAFFESGKHFFAS